MKKDDIELPELPVPRTKTDGGIELFAEYSVREYARAAIEPYKQSISELEAQLEAIGAGGVSSQRITSQRRGEPVAYPSDDWVEEFFGNPDETGFYSFRGDFGNIAYRFQLAAQAGDFITTTQAEAYADARVRGALEEAARQCWL